MWRPRWRGRSERNLAKAHATKAQSKILDRAVRLLGPGECETAGGKEEEDEECEQDEKSDEYEQEEE